MKNRIFLGRRKRFVMVLALTLMLAIPALAQGPGTAWTPTFIEEPGMCDGGAICGPSGAFTAADFPTANPIDWNAFPANPLRPHLPADGGQVWVVNPAGSDDAAGSADAPFATIDRALQAATSGDVIQVADGTYPVGLYDDSLIMAAPGVTLMAEHIGGAVLEPLSEEWHWLAAIDARADDLIIDGFVIRGFRDGAGVLFGRLDSPQRNLVLRHLWIENTGDALRSQIPPDRLHEQPIIDGLLLYDVALRDALIGFNCGEGPCDNVRMEALSIDLGASSGQDTGSWGDAIAVERGSNVVIFNAEITGAGADGIDLKAERVAAANVLVHDVARNGIKFWHGGDVINALVYNTGADAAVVFDDTGLYRVANSTIARHAAGSSAYVGTVAYDNPEHMGTIVLVNTIFYQNAGALWVSGEFMLDVRYTLFYGSTNGQEIIWAHDPPLFVGEDESPVTVLEEAGGGCCNIAFTDPGFMDPDAGDYTLSPGAVTRDAGTGTPEVPLPPFDLLGNARQTGAAVDLGPYEMSE